MKSKKTITMLLLSLTLVGCQWAYEQENIFDGHLSTKAERDNARVLQGKNPISRPTYDEYKKSITDKKLDNSSILP